MKTAQKDFQMKKSGGYEAYITPSGDLHIVRSSSIESGEFEEGNHTPQFSPDGQNISCIVKGRRKARVFVILFYSTTYPLLAGILLAVLVPLIAVNIFGVEHIDFLDDYDSLSVLESFMQLFIGISLLSFLPAVIFALIMASVITETPKKISMEIQLQMHQADGLSVPISVGRDFKRLFTGKSQKYRVCSRK